MALLVVPALEPVRAAMRRAPAVLVVVVVVWVLVALCLCARAVR